MIIEQIREGLERLSIKGAHGLMIRPQEDTFYQCNDHCQTIHKVTPIIAMRIPCDYCEQHWVIQSEVGNMAAATSEVVIDTMMDCVEFYINAGVQALITGELHTILTPDSLTYWKQELLDHCPKRRGEEMIHGVPFPHVGAFIEKFSG